MDFSFFKKIYCKDYVPYPILIGILFITNELRSNIHYYSIWQILLLISIVSTFCTLVIFLTRRFIKDTFKANLIAALFITINIFYSDIVSFFLKAHFFKYWFVEHVSRHLERFVLPSLVIFFFIFTIYVLKSKRKLGIINLYFYIIIYAFICVEVAKWLFSQNDEIKTKPILKELKYINRGDSYKPDIYYIILDEYTNNNNLKQFWSFDNSAFVDSLKNEGFFYVKNSKSDYTSTMLCIPSYLNFSLLGPVTEKDINKKSLDGLVFENTIMQYLKNQGYSIINYSIFDTKYSEKYYNTDTFWEKNYFRRTVWYSIILIIKSILTSSITTFSIPRDLAYYIKEKDLSIFRLLGKVKDNPKNCTKPIFVYAHIMMTHEPYYFDTTGNEFSNLDKELPEKNKYLKQLVFTNSLVESTVKEILSKSKSKPIIIIQGDHGYRGLHDISAKEKEKVSHSIFNALLLPCGGNNLLNDSVRPVNTFRIILNYYFGQKLPLL